MARRGWRVSRWLAGGFILAALIVVGFVVVLSKSRCDLEASLREFLSNFEYGTESLITSGPTRADVYAAIADAIPAATIAWTIIKN